MAWIRRSTLSAGAAFAVLPIYWMVITAFKPSREIGASPPTFWPHDPTLDNFREIFSQSYMGEFLRNSAIVVVGSVALAMLFGCLAAYAMARFRLPRKLDGGISFGVLAIRMLPPIVIVVPVFVMILRLGMIDSYPGLILVLAAVNLPIVIWMMRSFFEEIPASMEEAAMTDGASRMRALVNVVLPLVAPGMAATAIFTTVLAYNEFVYALVLTSTPAAEPVPVGVATFIGRIEIDYGALAAAGVVALVPVVVFALAMQRHLVRGLTMGSVK